jgi:hypothetical protein
VYIEVLCNILLPKKMELIYQQPSDKEDTQILGADQLEAEEMEVMSEEESEIESDGENKG